MGRRVRVWVDVTDPGIPGVQHVSASGWDLYVDGEHIAGLVGGENSAIEGGGVATAAYERLAEAMVWSPSEQTFPF